MNIFYLDKSPYKAATMLCDAHQKMILESVQMLSTSQRLSGHPTPDVFYKSTHINHPSSVWVRSGTKNYRWVLDHALALETEMKWRKGREKPHASLRLLPHLETSHGLEDTWTCPAVACKDVYKVFNINDEDDVIRQYRYYYIVAKEFAVWTKRSPPDWYSTGKKILGSSMIVGSSKHGITYTFSPASQEKIPDLIDYLKSN